jgi:hypothetical protein
MISYNPFPLKLNQPKGMLSATWERAEVEPKKNVPSLNNEVKVMIEETPVSVDEHYRRYQTNPEGYEINNPVHFPINYKIGFATVEDLITVTEKNNILLESIIFTVHNLSQNREPLQGLNSLYKEYEHTEVVDFQPIASLLLSEGFYRGGCGESNVKFIKLNELNLPVSIVEISKKGTTVSNLISGIVSNSLFNEINNELLQS